VRTRVAAAAVGVLALALVAVVMWRVLGTQSDYERALSLAPADTLRATYTDWASVRDAVGGTTLGRSASRQQVQAFLDRAYDRDLLAASGIDESTYALQRHYGFSPLEAHWELLGQGPSGQVDVLRLGEDVDLAAVERSLQRLGYADEGEGTWLGSADLVAGIDGELSPVQQNFVVLPDERLVLMSDSGDYVRAAADVVRRGARSLLDTEGVSRMAAAAGDPVTATLWASTFACEDLRMGQADEEDQRVADQLVETVGGLHPLLGMVMARQAGDRVVVAMNYETEEQAGEDLQARVDLASGDAPGQGGSFTDRFTVTDGRSTGRLVVLTLRAQPGADLLGDLGQGPVLFAAC
jgi:hypothetical protein